VTIRTWLALALSTLFAGIAVALLHRRALRSEPGRRFFQRPGAKWATAVLAFFVTVAVCAPLVAPYGPSLQLDIVGLQNSPPSWVHPLGTDLYSRDLWSRLLYGGRVSLAVGALAMALAVTVGALVGAAAGYFRRWVDAVLMRVVDVGLAFPRIFLLLVTHLSRLYTRQKEHTGTPLVRMANVISHIQRHYRESLPLARD